ncbi:hypothetical protein TanjilG_12334 [Lupinus angustifolius]|uniref:DUF632 domain-containing protein n=2 Tax=Lupinus angustifolius TaxID=3871 RepID=A0A4P1QXY9_LUPAN|nr:hypothetical protein TanjilG_12334 [Lupinus angustifolius]
MSLCRERCKFVNQALSQSCILADAHVKHIESLQTLGSALLSFFTQFEETHVSYDTHIHFVSDSEAQEDNKELQISSPCDDVAFMNYEQTHCASFSPPPPNRGGFYGSKPPPPPPPTSSVWDYLNFFEPYERYEVTYNTNRDSYIENVTEVREKGKVACERVQKGEEYDLRGKKLVSEKKWKESEECSNSDSVKVESKKVPCEAAKEIQILFQKASDSGKPILEMLDVGKFHYHSNFAFNQVSCKMMQVFTPSIRSFFGLRIGIEDEVVDKDNDNSYGNLRSTLDKLCMWEKKLYHEVKAEKKLRILHQKKCRQLKSMDKNGADAGKVETVQTSIGLLDTKMKMSIQVVDNISITISKLREEELWPHINNFIHMFLKMWKDMQECYKEIAEAKALDASTFNRKLSSGQIDAAIKLKSVLQHWNLTFSNWIHAQKSHVKALNGWLVRCLMYEPEQVPDDSPPLSPHNIGVPPVFVICDKWTRVVDNISEKNAIEAVNGFILRVSELLEKHILDLQQKFTLERELERKVQILERQEQKMQKVVHAGERNIVPNPIAREESEALVQRDVVHHGDFFDIDGIQSDLKMIFSAMERFTASTAQLYEELCQQIKLHNPVLGESNKIL